MTNSNKWLLPEGVQEILPKEAQQIESIRRQILDTFHCWGYDQVIPPMIEFLDSLLVGTGSDLELKTFKITDQISGKTLGIRADMTPQVARIDAHHIKKEGTSRLCYMGSVLHTKPEYFGKSRSPLQIGAEFYGHDGVESDIEIISLMLETLEISGIKNSYLDLGHVGIFRELIKLAGCDSHQEAEIFEILQRKAKSELNEYLNQIDLADNYIKMIVSLVDLNGSEEILSDATKLLQQSNQRVMDAVEYLKTVANYIKQRFPTLNIIFDLAEIREYQYHTGIVFASYVDDVGEAIARGGRYNDIGKVFGRSRPATGFSTDLKLLINNQQEITELKQNELIAAPWSDDKKLHDEIESYRSQGCRVISVFDESNESLKEQGFNRQLVFSNGQWNICKI